jgi:F-type H+-transporting ATPase subunit b
MRILLYFLVLRSGPVGRVSKDEVNFRAVSEMEIFKEGEFWVLIAFLLAVAFLVWKARPMLLGALDNRARRIKAELDEAARLRDEAQRTLAEFQAKQRDALKEAEGIVAQAKLEAERVAKDAERELIASLERRQKQAVEKIALAEAKATAEVRAQAVDIAIAAVRHMLAEDLSPARKSTLIDDAIADLSRRLN